MGKKNKNKNKGLLSKCPIFTDDLEFLFLGKRCWNKTNKQTKPTKNNYQDSQGAQSLSYSFH